MDFIRKNSSFGNSENPGFLGIGIDFFWISGTKIVDFSLKIWNFLEFSEMPSHFRTIFENPGMMISVYVFQNLEKLRLFSWDGVKASYL